MVFHLRFHLSHFELLNIAQQQNLVVACDEHAVDDGYGHPAGMAIYRMLGVIAFPLAYAFLFASHAPGSPVQRGLIFGSVLWRMMEVIIS